MNIGVIGCGVVGGTLVKAARQKGFTVYCMDKNRPEYNDPADKVLSCGLVFLCLPTPTTDGNQDISALHSVCAVLSSENYDGVVCVKSTVTPGTTELLSKAYPNLRLVHNPEFLTEANCFNDLLNQPVVLIGYASKYKATENVEVVSEFWRNFDDEATQICASSNATEFAKYFHNCFLAVKVSFFNEMFEASKFLPEPHLYKVALEMALAVGKIGKTHTTVPGPDGQVGFGGMCFPKDTQALLTWGEIRGLRMETLEGAVSGNKRRRPGG